MNLAKLLDAAVDDREVILIRRSRGEDVALIAADELESLPKRHTCFDRPRTYCLLFRFVHLYGGWLNEDGPGGIRDASGKREASWALSNARRSSSSATGVVGNCARNRWNATKIGSGPEQYALGPFPECGRMRIGFTSEGRTRSLVKRSGCAKHRRRTPESGFPSPPLVRLSSPASLVPGRSPRRFLPPET